MWLMIAQFFGFLASNSSSTRGRPCVISSADCNTAGMEGTHGQLGTRLTDGLCRDDTDRFAHGNRFAVCQVGAVALRADAILGLAVENGTDLHAL